MVNFVIYILPRFFKSGENSISYGLVHKLHSHRQFWRDLSLSGQAHQQRSPLYVFELPTGCPRGPPTFDTFLPVNGMGSEQLSSKNRFNATVQLLRFKSLESKPFYCLFWFLFRNTCALVLKQIFFFHFLVLPW